MEPADRRQALLLNPANADDAMVVHVLFEILKEYSFVVTRFDRSAPLREDDSVLTILDAIQSSSIVIADISRSDPNVWYELGFTHALRKPTVLLSRRDSETRLPSDLVGHLFIPYDRKEIGHLRMLFRAALQQYIRRGAGT